MSKKTTTTTTNQYDPTAKSAYDAQVAAGSNALLGEINNPTGNMFFQQQQQMQNLNNANMFGSAQQALNQRLQQQGISPNSPLYQQQLGQLQRQQMAAQSQGYNQLLLNAGNLRQSAISSAMSFNPLQTGSTQVQKTGGVGSWLPQIAGAAVGGVMGLATGGLSGVASNMGGFNASNTASNFMTPTQSPASSYWSQAAPIAPNIGADQSYNSFLNGSQSVIPGM
jgi:hypothetical protein